MGLFNNDKEDYRNNMSKVILNSFLKFLKNNSCIRELSDTTKVAIIELNMIDQMVYYISKEVENCFEDEKKSKRRDPKEVSSSLAQDIIRYLDSINTTILEGLTIRDKNNKKDFIARRILAEQQVIYNATSDIFVKLTTLLEQQRSIIATQEETIQKQHDNILKYENDVIFKTKKELIMEMIQIADQIQFTIDDHKINKDYESLMESLYTLAEWADGVLKDQTVCKFESAKINSKKFDPKIQEVVGIESTNNPLEDGSYKSILPGYYWTMPLVGSQMMNSSTISQPQSFKFVLRSENIVKLEYKKSKTDENSSYDLRNSSDSDWTGHGSNDSPYDNGYNSSNLRNPSDSDCARHVNKDSSYRNGYSPYDLRNPSDSDRAGYGSKDSSFGSGYSSHDLKNPSDSNHAGYGNEDSSFGSGYSSYDSRNSSDLACTKYDSVNSLSSFQNDKYNEDINDKQNNKKGK